MIGITTAFITGGLVGVCLGIIVGAAVMMFTGHPLAERQERARRAEAEPDWGHTHG